MDWSVLLALCISVILIGFFSGLESAFLSVNKLSIQLSKKRGNPRGKTWDEFTEHPTRFIGMLLVAVNLVIILYGLFIGDLLFPLWKWFEKYLPNSTRPYLSIVKLIFETILAFSILLFVEFFSKAYFRARSNRMLASGLVTFSASFFYSLLSSFASLFVRASEWLLRYMFNVKIFESKSGFSKLDFENYIQQSKNAEEDDNSDINNELFENALSLRDVKLRECLIPRKEIESIDIQTSVEEARKKFIETKLSKLVIYENNIDSILGYVHQLDLFRQPGTLKEILKPIPVVPESMSATDLMSKFSAERKSIAWVIDEFGGTAGIVTMEDLLEEIFGEIEDEYDDAEDLVEQPIANGEYIFSGRLELDYIYEKYHLPFDEEKNAETLSGYIIEKHESIPKQKERIIIDDYEIEIMNVSDTRIELVKLKILR